MTPAPQVSPSWDAFAAPVEVQTCRVELNSFSGNDITAGYPAIAGVEVRFVDRSSKTASEVVFRITAGNITRDVTDRGKFSPGVPIDAVFYDFAGRDYWRPQPEACGVVRVRFSDGTTWQPRPHLR